MVPLEPVNEKVLAFSHISHIYTNGGSMYITYAYRRAAEPEATLQRWQTIVPPMPGDADQHWSMMHGGHIMLRDDSAMNLSPEMFSEFIAPRNQRLLDTFGGGAEHFCGRGEHFISRMGALRTMHAVAMSQPDWNDMETIYRHTVDRGIKLIGLARDAAEAALARGRDLHGQVHCW